MMKMFYALLIALMFFSTYAIADNDLTCMSTHFNENKFLPQAPNGAARISKHILEVKYRGGMKQFIDEPPHEELSGIHWNYCGYNEKAKVHLIGHQTEGLFTGSILFEETGKIINAGHTVVISPDKQKFLAIEQEDGMDGENWTLFDMSGKKLWSGYAGITIRILGNNYDSVYAQFENPYFSDDEKVTAQVVCSNSSKKGVMTLSKSGNQWKWLPEFKC